MVMNEAERREVAHREHREFVREENRALVGVVLELVFLLAVFIDLLQCLCFSIWYREMRTCYTIEGIMYVCTHDIFSAHSPAEIMEKLGLSQDCSQGSPI